MVEQSKVVFLNTWSHRCGVALNKFLLYQCDADIICLTEVTNVDQAEIDRHGTNVVFDNRPNLAAQVDGARQLRQLQDSHTITYCEGRRAPWNCKVTGRTFNNVGFGSALLARINVDWIDGGDHRIEFGLDDVHDRVVVQWVVYQKQNIRYLVAHFHGVWLKANTKGDSAVRLEQSRQVRTLLAQLQLQYQVDKVIFGGDFNLDIKTESLRILCEGEGADDTVYRNLIVEQNIVSTRTSLYREYGQSGACLYADYVLVSKGVKVERFEVRTHTLISDHASLIVTFS